MTMKIERRVSGTLRTIEERDRRVDDLRDALGNELPHGVDVVRVDRHDVAVRVRVEIFDGQGLHLVEQVHAESAERALCHVDHQAVVQPGGEHADEEDADHFEDGFRQRSVIRVRHFGERDDVVVDEGPHEERSDDGRDARQDDADDDDHEVPLVPRHHVVPDPLEQFARVFDLFAAAHQDPSRRPVSASDGFRFLLFSRCCLCHGTPSFLTGVRQSLRHRSSGCRKSPDRSRCSEAGSHGCRRRRCRRRP